MRGGKTILVVEDDPGLRQLYWQALTFEGFNVIAAEDGLTALECVNNAAPDLVVLDLNVPRLSGHQLLYELMSTPATTRIPIVIVTGVDPADVAAQAAALLCKPVPLHQVVGEIHRLMSVPC